MRVNIYTTLLSILLLAVILPGLLMSQDDELVGDRPDLTESSLTVGHLRLQIEAGFGWERVEADGVEENLFFMPTLFRLGFGDSFELRMETAALSKLNVDFGTYDTSISGFAPITLGIKYNFTKGDDDSPSLAILMATEIPSGTDEFETEDNAFALKFIADFTLSDNLGLGTNLGLINEKDFLGENYYSFEATGSLGIDLSDKFGAFMELAYASAEYSDGGAAVLFDGGLTYLAQENLQFDVAFGTGLSGDFVPDFFMTSGMIVKF